MNHTLVDGHVHFHPQFSLGRFLDCAWANFNRAESVKLGVLLLGQIGFGPPLANLQSQLRDLATNWKADQPDSTSMVFDHAAGHRLIVVAGRQLVSKEKLELLTLCTDHPFRSERPLLELIQEANQVGAISVVPWGFGKWWFQRGRWLGKFIRDHGSDPRWYVGDNGCRMQAHRPVLLDLAQQAGIPCLAGSDPLPLKPHEQRAGSYGSILSGMIDGDRPTAWLQESLTRPDFLSRTYGSCRTVTGFVFDQIGLRLSKA